MTTETPHSGIRKIVYLAFPPNISGQPVVCNLARLFDLTFNILKAQITPRQEGFMTLELMGTEENFAKGVDYLKQQSIRITPAAQKILRVEDNCTHCGMCTAICPTAALVLKRDSRLVAYLEDECSACGLCTRVCPSRAMILDTEDTVPEGIESMGDEA